MPAGLELGIGLVIAGLVFVILVWGLLRLLPNREQSPNFEIAAGMHPTVPESSEAILIVQSGGRVESLNTPAREWFGLREEDVADLERLARRARPPDDFLDVCAAPGQKRISVNGKLAELTSYQVPGPYPRMLVSLRELDLAPALADNNPDVSSSILKVIVEFGQAIASNLTLASVLRSILDNVGRLVAADLLEIKVWNKDLQGYDVYQLQGETHQLISVTQSQFGNLSEKMTGMRSVLLIADTHSSPAQHSNGGFNAVRSYLGVPLIAGLEMNRSA